MDPLLLGETIYRGLTAHGMGAPLIDQTEFVRALRALADWCDRDGFIPFVDPATGRAPR